MKRVFFAEFDPRKDVSGAEQFGELIYLLTTAIPPLEPSVTVPALDRALDFHKFDPANDVIALTGMFQVVSTLMFVVARKYPGTIRVLMFDSRYSVYREKQLTMEELP